MATTPMTRTSMLQNLKTVYTKDEIKRIFSRDRILHQKLEAKPQELDEGLEFKWAVHTGGSSAGGHVAENANIPTTDTQKIAWMTFNMATYLHTVGYTGQYKHSTGSRRAAAVNGVTFMVENAIQDAKDDIAIAHYTPANGMLTKCRAATSTTVFNVENPQRLRVGQNIVVALIATPGTVSQGIGDTNAAPGTVGTDFTTITDISGNTITVSDALSGVSWTLDSYGNAEYAVYGYQDWVTDNRDGKISSVFGLEDIISESNPVLTTAANYGQIDRDVVGNGWAKGKYMDLAGGHIDHDIAEEALELVSVNTADEVDYWVAPYEVYREVKKLHYGDKAATYKTEVGNNWFTSAVLADKPMFADRFCTKRRIYGISEKRIGIRENLPMGWVDDDGDMWSRIPNKWAFEALLARMYQICACPSSHVVIDNVTSTSYA